MGKFVRKISLEKQQIVRLNPADEEELYFVLHGNAYIDDDGNEIVEAIAMCQLGRQTGVLTPVELITVELIEPSPFPPGGPKPGGPGYGRRKSSVRLEHHLPLAGQSALGAQIHASVSDARIDNGTADLFLDLDPPK